ncbi:MAG: CDP-alcohol phosphatidyltransferase family protein [Chloroflexi bacterium]|nr:CDP-alcohol phosphatidyltransferase family protein [Chloroflexota bacterium]
MAQETTFTQDRNQAQPVNVANLITIARFPLLIVVVLLLYGQDGSGLTTAVALTALLIFMDTLDGVVARHRNETTLLGSALDIATDRAVEIVLWVVYAHLGLISVLIPLVVIVRGTLTDSIRSVAVQNGISAHGMMRSRLGKWLVASSPMRTGYSLVKLTAFMALTSTLALQANGAVWEDVYQVGVIASWAAMGICILRGLPVLVEAPAFFRSLETKTNQSLR